MIENFLNELAIEAVSTYTEEMGQEDEYNQLKSKYSALWEKLKENASTDSQTILLDLDDTVNDINSYFGSFLYQKGLKDGLKLSKIFNE